MPVPQPIDQSYLNVDSCLRNVSQLEACWRLLGKGCFGDLDVPAAVVGLFKCHF